VTRVSTFPDARAAARFAAQEIADALREALASRGAAHVALAGGDTPRPAYEALAGMVEDWSGVELWYGDERCVGPDDPESTHRLVVESLLAAIAGRPPIEHRVQGELGAEAAAGAYERELRARVPVERAVGVDGSRSRAPVPTGAGGLPALDLVLLGLGGDGHTASLFPGNAAVDDESGALCLAVHDAPKPPPDRVTLSLPVLRAARRCLLLVTGAGKAGPLAAALGEPDRAVPASLLAAERLHVVADAAAAASVPRDGTVSRDGVNGVQ
jgi:6-phosphogluconolactonase